MDETKLDNPVWFALTETHHNLLVEYGDFKFYHPDYCPFGAFDKNRSDRKGIEKYAVLCENFFIVANKPNFPGSILLKNELICDQMIIERTIDLEKTEEIISLSSEQSDELFELVNLVQPGYFRPRSSQLGNYYGIFKHNKLVAVTGERMKMQAYTEVSAVVTHPDYTGKGYAKQLVAHTVNNIFTENKIPFLHVSQSNTAAIQLYEKLGFVRRRKISFWNFVNHTLGE